MNIIDSLILGIIQGVTEFLPVSSSGHLTLVEHFLGAKEVPLLFDIILHVASLLAVIIFFRKRIMTLIQALYKKEMKSEKKEILFIIISTIITGSMVFMTKPAVLYLKKNPQYLIFTFIFTAVILLVADRLLKRKNSREELTVKDSIITGVFQGFAVLPGISRSGSTIFAGLISGVKAEKAVEYSFLLAIPAILGAVVLEMKSGGLGSIGLTVTLFGFVASFIASLLSLKLLVFLIKKTILKPFSFYLFALAAVILNIYWL